MSCKVFLLYNRGGDLGSCQSDGGFEAIGSDLRDSIRVSSWAMVAAEGGGREGSLSAMLLHSQALGFESILGPQGRFGHQLFAEVPGAHLVT